MEDNYNYLCYLKYEVNGEAEKAKKFLEIGVEKKELYCLLKSIEKKIEAYQNEDDLNYVIYFKKTGKEGGKRLIVKKIG